MPQLWKLFYRFSRLPFRNAEFVKALQVEPELSACAEEMGRTLESRIPTGEKREELLQIVKAAVEARNGWKKILKMCSDENKSQAAWIPAKSPGV